MEIEIQSKTNNPLLKRTEVHFIIHHASEGTPKRELVRSELAEKMNVKKENVMVNFMKSSFGSTETVGYAKVYKSVKEVKSWERKYVLRRNNVIAPKRPAKEKEKKLAEKPEDKGEKKPVEQPEEMPEQKEETTEQPKEEEKPAEKTESVEKAAEEKAELKEEVAEKSKEGKKSTEEKKE